LSFLDSGPAGLLLALNPTSVAYIGSYYSKKLGQNMLRIGLNNRHDILVHEEDADGVLEALGLGEYKDDWVLDLEKDIG
jgi:hypothetical protein